MFCRFIPPPFFNLPPKIVLPVSRETTDLAHPLLNTHKYVRWSQMKSSGKRICCERRLPSIDWLIDLIHMFNLSPDYALHDA